MIDTDKYEGHIPGPWVLYKSAAHGPKIAGKLNDADWQLIKDAPLLLAEVKELRAWKKFVSDIVKQQNGPHLREMLKELIE